MPPVPVVHRPFLNPVEARAVEDTAQARRRHPLVHGSFLAGQPIHHAVVAADVVGADRDEHVVFAESVVLRRLDGSEEVPDPTDTEDINRRHNPMA